MNYSINCYGTIRGVEKNEGHGILWNGSFLRNKFHRVWMENDGNYRGDLRDSVSSTTRNQPKETQTYPKYPEINPRDNPCTNHSQTLNNQP